jgi:hypothetical protein
LSSAPDLAPQAMRRPSRASRRTLSSRLPSVQSSYRLTSLRSRELLLLLSAILLAIATRNWVANPSVGLDPSWTMGLHYWSRGAANGQPVDFTYGPLGFLSAPTNWARLTALLAVTFTLVVRAALAYLLLRLVLARQLLISSVAALWLVMAVVDGGGTAETLEWLAFAWALFRWDRCIVAGSRLLLVEGMSIGIAGLVKTGSALVVAVVLIVVNLALGHRGWRARAGRVVGLLGVATLAVVVGWALSGQPFSQFVPWLHASGSLVDGYGAMALEEPGRGPEYGWAIAGMAVVAGVWWICSENRPWAPLLLLGFLYLEFKHGFVRHDAHSVTFFLALLTGLLLVPHGQVGPAPWARNLQIALVQVFALLLLAVVPFPVHALPGPISSIRSLVREGSLLTSGREWKQQKSQTQASMRRDYALDEKVLDALHGGVQVDPWDAGVVYAYDLQWHPVPIFQLYSAYTPWLDERNANALTEDPPARILRSATYSSIDGRFGLFESPRYQYEEACRYHEVASSKSWQVLALGPSRCGRWHLLGQYNAGGGRSVAVPQPSAPDAAVIARISFSPSQIDHLLDLILKSPNTPQICLDDRCYRFVTATAGGPLLIRKAAWMPYGPGGDADLQPAKIRLRDLPGSAELEFFEVSSR